jgi:hypothetical protein
VLTFAGAARFRLRPIRDSARFFRDLVEGEAIMTRTGLSALAAIAALSAAPARAAPAQYDVRLIVRDGDAAPTTPRLIVNSGEPATFEIARPSYSMRLVATPAADGRISLASDISTWAPYGIHRDASTVTLDANGAPSTILFPHTDPGTGVVRQMRVEVSVRPVS